MLTLSVWPWVSVVAALGCHSQQTKQCLELMASAQGTVNDVNPADTASVEASIGAVDRALTACTAAGRTTEQAELAAAKKQLVSHLDDLKQRQNRAKPVKRTPEELAALVRNGDPSCPRGQAWRDPDAKKEVRCTGPEPVGMNFAQAKSYFDGRGYKLTTTDAPPVLKAEFGAELLVFHYATPGDSDPPRCLEVYPPPGESWQEAAARVTGESPRRLQKATTVKTDRGELALHVDDTTDKVLVQIGDCGASTTPAPAGS